MSPKRKAALQWFHDRGEVGWFKLDDNPPSKRMMRLLERDGQLSSSTGGGVLLKYSLTDKGRRDLHEATS